MRCFNQRSQENWSRSNDYNTRKQPKKEVQFTTLWISTVIVIVIVDVVDPCSYSLMKSKYILMHTIVLVHTHSSTTHNNVSRRFWLSKATQRFSPMKKKHKFNKKKLHKSSKNTQRNKDDNNEDQITGT